MFDSVPATTGASAVEVLGQSAFETAGRSQSQGGLYRPSAVAVREGRMVVAGAMAHRVLVYDRIPEPGGQLIVADAWNHRVLVWDAVPATQEAFDPPTRVVGPPLAFRR